MKPVKLSCLPSIRRCSIGSPVTVVLRYMLTLMSRDFRTMRCSDSTAVFICELLGISFVLDLEHFLEQKMAIFYVVL